ncbi:hypothetical protein BJY22_002540 [Kribbella shirazensis]|uniref:HEAT repeat domain-containing protein n=2 Tax=Kribbella shirazensis TaxID=1105143 RepID=A0A7X6A0D4_9ACTN|nr:hypothetical protein [Kribbella shirazensis]
MADATAADFRRVEFRLNQLEGRGVRDLVARCHCKLATWATDHGWLEVATHHYDEAHRHAGGELRRVLDGVGNWFGRTQSFTLGSRKDSDMTRFPWIMDRADNAARREIDDQFKRSFRSPWTRTITLGGASAVEGVDIQSAELQASWAGAVWLMPAIHRLHAALILGNSRTPVDVARGIGLWVRGGGSQIGNLIDSSEAYLTKESVADLLTVQLRGGRNVFGRERWLEACQTLWDEMPDELVDSLLANSRLPSIATGYGLEATELYLHAALLNRSPAMLERSLDSDDASIALLARCLSPSLVEALPLRVIGRMLSAVVTTASGPHEDWKSRGWSVLPRLWRAAGNEQDLRDRLLALMPHGSVPEAAVSVPEFVPNSLIDSSLQAAIERIYQDIADADRGRYAGHASQPAWNVARLLFATERHDSTAIAALVEMASSGRVLAEQRLASLNALRLLAEHGLLDAADVEGALSARKIASFMTDDLSADQRLDDISRIALRARFGPVFDLDAELLAASRDPDTRVRKLAVDSISWLSRQAFASAARDAALLGALYDPHPRVQAAALPALWRGDFASESVRRVAHGRVEELWPEAHRDLRLAVAREISRTDSVRGDQDAKLQEFAQVDRSWLVREYAKGSGSAFGD